MTSAARLEPQLMRSLERFHLVSRRPKSGGMKGQHRSRNRGSGIEFSDYREYVEGDDHRHVDWRAYLRHDRLLVRQFEEEGDLPIYLAIDCSTSMRFPSDRPFAQAQRLAGALGFMALKHLDRVTLLPFAERTQVIGPLYGPSRTFALFDLLDRVDVSGGTSLEEAMSAVLGSSARPGLVVVISDFLSATALDALERVRFRSHDLLAVHIVADPDDRLPTDGDWTLRDVETGETHRIEATPRLATEAAAEETKYASRLRGHCRKHGWGYAQLGVSDSIAEFVRTSLRREQFVR